LLFQVVFANVRCCFIGRDDGCWLGLRNAYDIFEKTTVSLPNTCVEAAEHALKCMFKGSHSGGRIKDGDGAEISMQLGDSVKYDIDQEDMNEKSFKFFGGKGSAADAKTELFRPGEGMALVFSKSESSRKEGEWKVHALAIVLVSQDPFDQFMIVEEEFSADEENKKVKMGKSWKLAAYRDATDFVFTYHEIMPATKYKLWKLRAS
jgi:hypothetical protein